MIETFLKFAGILAVLVALPFVVFLSAKLGAYGWLRGVQIFEEQNAIKKKKLKESPKAIDRTKSRGEEGSGSRW